MCVAPGTIATAPDRERHPGATPAAPNPEPQKAASPVGAVALAVAAARIIARRIAARVPIVDPHLAPSALRVAPTLAVRPFLLGCRSGALGRLGRARGRIGRGSRRCGLRRLRWLALAAVLRAGGSAVPVVAN